MLGHVKNSIQIWNICRIRVFGKRVRGKRTLHPRKFVASTRKDVPHFMDLRRILFKQMPDGQPLEASAWSEL